MTTDEQVSTGERRIIKRYSNRKLYDTTESRYVTLQEIGELVRLGEDVQIIDNKTKEDKTEATLALILSEDLKNKPRSVPLSTLRALIQERGNRMLSTLRGGPLGRLIPSQDELEQAEELAAAQGQMAEAVAAPQVEEAAEPQEAGEGAADDKKKRKLEGLVETSRQTLDQLQLALDERVKAVVPGLGPIRELREELISLTLRIEAIERHLGLSPPAPKTDAEDD